MQRVLLAILSKSQASHSNSTLSMIPVYSDNTLISCSALWAHQTKLKGQSWAWEMELLKYEITADVENECNVYNCTITKNILSWIFQQICLRAPATREQRESFKER